MISGSRVSASRPGRRRAARRPFIATGADGIEFADDARPVLLGAAALQRQLAGLEPALDMIELIGVLRHPRLQQGEQWRAGDHRFRQGFRALLQQPETTLAIERPAVALQDLVDLLRVAGLYGMARSFLGHVLGQQRGGCTQVQLVDPLRLVGAQLALQEHGEQRVIAVPAAQAVQRLDEQAATLEPFEHLAAVTGLGQTIGRGGVEAVEQAGRLEKTAQVIGQPSITCSRM